VKRYFNSKSINLQGEHVAGCGRKGSTEILSPAKKYSFFVLNLQQILGLAAKIVAN